MNGQKGFTLVEVAIAIVVVGLLALSISSARDLIRATYVRSVISDVHNFKNSIAGFHNLYKYLPGDLNIAGSFWPDKCLDDGSNICNGNANGDIAISANEGLRAWQHLSLSGVLPGEYSGILDKREEVSFKLVPSDIFFGSAYAGQPKTTICHNGNTITVANPAVLNGHLGHGDTIGSCEGTGGESGTGGLGGEEETEEEDSSDYGKFTVGWNVPASRIEPAGFKLDWNDGNMITFAAERNPYLDAAAINPQEAWNIDKKIDDGQPSNGFVYSADGNGATGCVIESGYNVGSEEVVCQMHFWIDRMDNGA